MKLFLVLILFPFLTTAQIIKGTIKDTNGNSIVFSNILLKENSNPSSILEFTNVRNGLFSTELKNKYQNLLIEVSSTSYYKETFIIQNPIRDKIYNVDFILKKNAAIALEEVVINQKKKPYQIMGDTLSFNVDSYKDISDRKVQDVLKRMPGIEVDEKSGQIKYNGKPIENVTLDGDDLFGHNYTLGTKNINIDMIEQVQAISNYSANPLLKGIESSDKVSLNLKLKKDKVDFSGNIDFGLGINNNKNILNNSNANVLRITSKNKSFGILSYNNIGINNSPFDYFSNNKGAEKINEKDFTTQKVISETLFSNIIDDDRSNINNLLFTNYNNLFKINKRIAVKTNLYHLNDNLNFVQNSLNELKFDSVNFTTSDSFTTNKKPQLNRGDIEFKFNTSKNSLLETKTKFSYEQIKTKSSIVTNNLNLLQSSLLSRNILFNQNLIFTKKISLNKAFQIYANYAYNNIPQELLLTQTNISNSQNSNFKKEYFDTKFNLLGNINKLKYSTTFGGLFQTVPFLSNLNSSNLLINNNIFKYNQKEFYNRSSLNYQLNSLTISPSYSIKAFSQKLNDSLSKNNLLFEPSIYLRLKVDDKSSFSTKLSYNQNPFDEEFFFKNPVLITNRIKVSNTPSLEIQKSLNYNLNYRYNNLYNQFLMSLGFNYQKNKGAYFSEYLINNDETIINNFFSNEKSNNLSFDFTTEKFISFISTKVKLKSNYNKNNYINIINRSDVRNNINQVFVNEFSLKTAFNSKINIENNLTFNYLETKSSNNNSIKNKSFINSSKLKYKISQSIFTGLTLDYFLPNTTNKNNEYLFLDFNLIFKPKTNKYEFNLIGKNLLDNKLFSQIQATDFSKSIYQSNLISRYIFLNLTYNF